MNRDVVTVYIRLQSLANTLLRDESGQDLVEYALVIALIALGATASMSSVASSLSTAFSDVGSKLSNYVS
jgi:pilus assembly protein Flp/PilA